MPNIRPLALLRVSFIFLVPASAVVVSFGGCGQAASEAPAFLASVDPTLIKRHGQLYFVNDVRTGCQIAAQDRMPCLFFFTADWCTFCHHMAATAFLEPAVGELGRSFVCILVDADRESELCRYFSVTGYPTVEFVSPDGHSLHRLVGQQSPTSIVAGMRAALGRYAWVSDLRSK